MLKTTDDDYLKKLFKTSARNSFIISAKMKIINANKDYTDEKLIKENRNRLKL